MNSQNDGQVKNNQMKIFIVLVWVIVGILLLTFDQYLIRKSIKEKRMLIIILFGLYFSASVDWIRANFLSNFENRIVSFVIGLIIASLFIIILRLMHIFMNNYLFKRMKNRNKLKDYINPQ